MLKCYTGSLFQTPDRLADLAWCFGWSLYLSGGFKYFLIFTPIKGEDSYFDQYFSTGWFNHQLVTGMAPLQACSKNWRRRCVIIIATRKRVDGWFSSVDIGPSFFFYIWEGETKEISPVKIHQKRMKTQWTYRTHGDGWGKSNNKLTLFGKKHPALWWTWLRLVGSLHLKRSRWNFYAYDRMYWSAFLQVKRMVMHKRRSLKWWCMRRIGQTVLYTLFWGFTSTWHTFLDMVESKANMVEVEDCWRDKSSSSSSSSSSASSSSSSSCYPTEWCRVVLQSSLGAAASWGSRKKNPNHWGPCWPINVVAKWSWDSMSYCSGNKKTSNTWFGPSTTSLHSESLLLWMNWDLQSLIKRIKYNVLNAAGLFSAYFHWFQWLDRCQNMLLPMRSFACARLQAHRPRQNGSSGRICNLSNTHNGFWGLASNI